MTTALQYSEDYADPKAKIWTFTMASNPFPKPADYNGPTNYYDYLKTVRKNGNHREVFGYKMVNTDALDWIIHVLPAKAFQRWFRRDFGYH
jgi:CubicO group peptidase (beta-lactamase class C family)